MAKVYFQKHGVNNKIANRVGAPFTFEKLADAQGVLELDETDNANDIEDLRAWIKKGVGGVVELSNKAAFDDLKKNLALPEVKAAPANRIYQAKGPLEGTLARENAARATVPGVVAPAVVLKNAGSAAEQAQLAKLEEAAENLQAVLDSTPPAKPAGPRVGQPVPKAKPAEPGKPVAPPASK